MKPRHVLPVVLPVLGLALAFGCDKPANPVAPSGTILTATAVPSKIRLSGEPSTVTVTGIRPDGNPIRPGTQVTLSTSLGTLRPRGTDCSSTAALTIGEADDRGQVAAILCGDGRGGEATISATLTNSGTTPPSGGSGGSGGGSGGSAAGSTSVTIKVQIGETDASKPTLVMSANPNIVGGGGTSTISFLGRASDGTPVTEGQRIRMTANLGTLSCDRAFRCPGEGFGAGCSAVCTNSRGEAEASFIAGSRTGTGKVFAVLGTGDEKSLDITINGAIDELTLQSNKSSIPLNESGESIKFTATATDADGNPLGNILVKFFPDIGSADTASQLTSPQGQAVMNLTVNTQQVGTRASFVVRATAKAEGVERSASVTIRIEGR